MISLLGFVLASLTIGADAQKEFFPALINGDFQTAEAMIIGEVAVNSDFVDVVGSDRLSPDQFIGRISSCYPQAFYGNDETGEQIAALMCPLDPSKHDGNKSRVILLTFEFNDGGVVLSEMTQMDSTKEAPAPAFKREGDQE